MNIGQFCKSLVYDFILGCANPRDVTDRYIPRWNTLVSENILASSVIIAGLFATVWKAELALAFPFPASPFNILRTGISLFQLGSAVLIGSGLLNVVREITYVALGAIEEFERYAGLDQTAIARVLSCLLYTSPSPRDGLLSRMPSSA